MGNDETAGAGYKDIKRFAQRFAPGIFAGILVAVPLLIYEQLTDFQYSLREFKEQQKEFEEKLNTFENYLLAAQNKTQNKNIIPASFHKYIEEECTEEGEKAKEKQEIEENKQEMSLIAPAADINTRAGNGKTLLHLAIYAKCSSDFVKKLIYHGADINARYGGDYPGYSPLHTAAYEGHAEGAKALIEKGADVNVTDKNQKTPLHWAVSIGKNGIVKALIENDAHVSPQDREGNTPLHWAIDWGHDETAKILIDKRPDAEASRFAASRSVRLFSSSLNLQNINGNTPLHRAAQKGNDGIVKKLLAEKADVNAQNHEGNTPLHRAIHWGHDETAKILINADDASLNLQDREGNTPLHRAAQEGEDGIVSGLCDKGVNVNVKNHDGEKALDIANKTLQKEEEAAHTPSFGHNIKDENIASYNKVISLLQDNEICRQ
ncbi:MAG: ankyrin repeat domain-containing protein [Rhodobacteraceae bacterium]|nr:ankyrin repeat domain-containing protein [Paracoccaceae bacterium]